MNDTGSDNTSGIMIDAPDTADRDDALWVRHDDAGYDAWVHIALVARRMPLDSPQDRQARRAMHSRYLPDRTISMLPAEVEAAATLQEDAPQETVRVHMRFSQDGELIDTEVTTGVLDRSWAISYGRAAELVAEPEAPLHQQLTEAKALATTLLSRRRRDGALAFYDLFKGYATNEEGNLVRLGDNQRHIGYIIVQEFMIAANAAIATWCAARDLPILFRNHRAAAVAGNRVELLAELSAAEARGDSAAYEMLRKRMGIVQRPATYEPAVFGHFGLNLPAYAHNTSPLRRYPDLVNQRILLAATAGEPSPYDFATLEAIGADFNARIKAARDRRAERHKSAARQATRDRLVEAEFDSLDPGEFSKVLRLALSQPDPVLEPLVAETARRFAADMLPLRDSCEVLIAARGPRWTPLREQIVQSLAAEPSKAVTVISMYAQSIVGGPLSDAHLQWDVTSVGTVHQSCFSAVLRVNLGELTHESPARRQLSKRDAKAQAALALVAVLSDTEDLSSSVPLPEPVEPTARPSRIPADRNPTMAINEYQQLGAVSDVTWEYQQEGLAHQPEFTCTAQAVFSTDGAVLVATGTGTGKQAAKSAAAARLRAMIEDHLETAAAKT